MRHRRPLRPPWSALIVLTVLIGLVTEGCKRVPVTGRRQLRVVPEALMTDLGQATYQDALRNERVERRTSDAQRIRQVGRRLARRSRYADDFDWKFALFQSDQVNAWALPGGYIGVYEGILPVLENEAALAFVLAHEIAHTAAHHGAERMSQQLAVSGGLTLLDAYLSGEDRVDQQQEQLILGALGLGGQVGVLLPFSRKHEKEADTIGLMILAEAGYPPEEALEVWRRMDRAGGERSPSFLSTHPTPQDRIENLREHLPKARRKYRRNAIDRDVQSTIW